MIKNVIVLFAVVTSTSMLACGDETGSTSGTGGSGGVGGSAETVTSAGGTSVDAGGSGQGGA